MQIPDGKGQGECEEYRLELMQLLAKMLLELKFCDWKIESVFTWRGGRVVEGAALEMLFRGNFNGGSNPPLSVDLSNILVKCFNGATYRCLVYDGGKFVWGCSSVG